MPYVTLDSEGNITGVYQRPQTNSEFKADDDPALIAYIAVARSVRARLTEQLGTIVGTFWADQLATVGPWPATLQLQAIRLISELSTQLKTAEELQLPDDVVKRAALANLSTIPDTFTEGDFTADITSLKQQVAALINA